MQKKDTFYKLKKDDTHWMTREGDVISIQEMDKWHVFHTVKMLEKQSNMLSQDELCPEIYPPFIIPDLMKKRYQEFCNEYPEYCI
jgi:hypothetical protein